MTIQPIQDLFYFIKGAFNVVTSNWLLMVPIAMTLLYYGLKIITKLFNVLKKGE